MARQVVVVGAGKVGTRLASLLVSQGYDVTVVELREDALRSLEGELPGARIVTGSGTDLTVLEAARLRETEVVAAVTGRDEVNLVITSLARLEFGVPRVVARVNDPRNAWMFTDEMGVDLAVNQADLLAYLIAEEISLRQMTTLLKLTKGNFTLVEESVHRDATAAGRALRDLKFPPDCAVSAVLRGEELLVPRGDTVLQPGDRVLALIRVSRLPELVTILGPGGG